ncbi:RNA polymerase sigma factor [Anaerocolumna cellulosilytica]|uniref:RNA polymerase sigma factor n=1 Tax=Anaerocolumna cellulosilytica TaxID=433286 RepID=A0A6S6R6K1_9FIRM|nr:RNA polymerase sigma factor [Anaerocolumna cellulosilytica]
MERINRDIYLEHLIDAYKNLVFSICFKLVQNYFDAEDLTQETFLAAYKGLDDFDGTNEKAWICRIATNKCLDYLKHSGRKSVPTEDTYLNEFQSKIPTPEEEVEEGEVKNQLYTLCTQLKEPYREVALDYFFHEKDISDMVSQSGKNIKTLQTQVYRAKNMLKKLWRKE